MMKRLGHWLLFIAAIPVLIVIGLLPDDEPS
jgi:hypothetical protein